MDKDDGIHASQHWGTRQTSAYILQEADLQSHWLARAPSVDVSVGVGSHTYVHLWYSPAWKMGRTPAHGFIKYIVLQAITLRERDTTGTEPCGYKGIVVPRLWGSRTPHDGPTVCTPRRACSSLHSRGPPAVVLSDRSELGVGP